MAAIMLNAASMAYRKASAKNRNVMKSDPDISPWLAHFADQIHEDESSAIPDVLVESSHHKKERVLSISELRYEKFAWWIYCHITSTTQFDLFIMANIILVGITTGMDLENRGRDEWTVAFSSVVGSFTLAVFTFEVMVKIIAEAYEPWNYFLDPEHGNFNCFDFVIVFLSLLFVDTGGSAVSAIRMLRLVRLMTFIKHVRSLKVLVVGLVQGVKSVIYIVLMLVLIIYIFAILGCIMFGTNDPARFGDVPVAMMTLFQVSTLASWTSIAYVSWFGCEQYLGSPYGDDNPSRISSFDGNFEGFKCNQHTDSSGGSNPIATGLFFACFILLTAWVIMSLFVGVIAMGMFEQYIAMREEDHLVAYVKALAVNTASEAQAQARSDDDASTSLSKTSKALTLKQKIDKALEDKLEEDEMEMQYGEKYSLFVKKMKKIRDSNEFTLVVTFTIIAIGLVIGVDTDLGLKCERTKHRLKHDNSYDSSCEKEPTEIFVAGIVSQVIFTFEAFIKIAAEGVFPMRYFTDSENGSWNCVDFFIVIVGFLEYTPASFIFENFPVIILRLCRLLRVFRLAKALPRLRSIVEALISGFSSVGWICVLFAVFNYIVACMLIIIFRDNDPFHFGSISRAMFTMLRIETLDTWDQILYISMYGCKGYPAGYEFLVEDRQQTSCRNNAPQGWLGFLILCVVTIIGAYVLPIVLIGVVSIQFNQATRFSDILQQENEGLKMHWRRAQETMPDFFSSERLVAIKDVFDTLDSSGEKTLDMNEIAPFFHYVLWHKFNIQLSTQQFESLFYLLDMNHSGEVGTGDFVSFFLALKHFERKIERDPEYELKFYDGEVPTETVVSNSQTPSTSEVNDDQNTTTNNGGKGRKSVWDLAMERVDKDSLDSAWDSVLRSIQAVQGDTVKEKVNNLFKNFDSDGTGELDLTELGAGLESCGIRLNERQIHVLAKSVDKDGDGNISFDEFALQVVHIQRQRAEAIEKEEKARIQLALKKQNQTPNNNLDQQQLLLPAANDQLSPPPSKKISVEATKSMAKNPSPTSVVVSSSSFSDGERLKPKPQSCESENSVEISHLLEEKLAIETKISAMRDEVSKLEGDGDALDAPLPQTREDPLWSGSEDEQENRNRFPGWDVAPDIMGVIFRDVPNTSMVRFSESISRINIPSPPSIPNFRFDSMFSSGSPLGSAI